MAGRIGVLAMTLAVALTQASVVRAEVLAVERESFSIHHEQDVAAPPDAVFVALAHPGAWWNPEHSWSGDRQRFSLEPRAGGCWCESLPNGGSVEHGRIISYDPGQRLIVMQSLLGPLQTMAIAGRLEPDDIGLTRPDGADFVLWGGARRERCGSIVIDEQRCPRSKIGPPLRGLNSKDP